MTLIKQQPMVSSRFLRNSFAIAGLLISSSVYGQEAPQQQAPPPPQQMQNPMPRKTPEQKAQSQVRWMQKNLMITDAQSQRVYNIILNGAREDENAKMDGAPKGEKKAIKRDEMGELKQVLNPDQFQRYMAHVQEMKEKNRERKAGIQTAY